MSRNHPLVLALYIRNEYFHIFIHTGRKGKSFFKAIKYFKYFSGNK